MKFKSPRSGGRSKGPGSGGNGKGRSGAPGGYQGRSDDGRFEERPRSFRNDRPQGGGSNYRGDRPQWQDRAPREGGDRPQGNYRNDRPQGGGGNFRSDRPQSGGSNYRGDRPQGNFRSDSPQGGGGNFRNDRPQGGGNYRGDRPQWQDRAPREGGDRPQGNFRNDRPQGGGGNYRGDRPQGNFRNDRPQGGGNFRSDRPQGGGNYRGDRPQWQDRAPREGGDRPQGNFRSDRPQGGGNFRNDRPQGNFRSDRPQWQDRGEHPARPERFVRPVRQRVHPDDAAGQRDAGPVQEGPAPIAPPENMLVGRNPIREALRSGRHFESLYVQKGELNGSAREIVRMAREKRVIIKEVDRRALDNMSPGHQGLVGIVSAHQYATVEEIFERAEQKGEQPLLVILDGITDPHNFGAIARTAECCGAHGMIVGERRAVGMTPGAAKASAGAFEHLLIARVPNISRLIDEVKARGVWVYAADAQATEPYYKTDLKGPAALVIGDEGEGVSRLALEKCDGRVAIPIQGEIESLNASVAAGILLYEALRQRDV